MAPVVEAYQAMRGALVSRICVLLPPRSATCAGSIRQDRLMAFLGLVPAESSDRRYDPDAEGPHLSGQPAGRGGRLSRRPGHTAIPRESQRDLESAARGLPKPVRDIASEGPGPSACARYRRLSATGKKLPVVVAAIAREMAAFLWASDARSRQRKGDALFPAAAQSRGGSTKGYGELPSLVMWPGSRPTPVL